MQYVLLQPSSWQPTWPCVQCSLPAEQRTIPLATIGQRTRLGIDGVEFLLMKTLSLKLIEGVIDQVDGHVQVMLAFDLLCCLGGRH